MIKCIQSLCSFSVSVLKCIEANRWSRCSRNYWKLWWEVLKSFWTLCLILQTLCQQILFVVIAESRCQEPQTIESVCTATRTKSSFCDNTINCNATGIIVRIQNLYKSWDWIFFTVLLWDQRWRSLGLSRVLCNWYKRWPMLINGASRMRR